MRKLLRLHLAKVLLIAAMVTGVNSWGQGSENFSNIPASASSYANRSWTGTNSVTWTATAARTDQTLTGKAICTNGNGTVTSPTYTGGMGTLQFNYVRGFTAAGTRSIDVYVNGTKIGNTIAVNASNSTVQAYSAAINVAGNVILELRTSGSQIVIDDISWTGYSAGPSTTVTTTSFSGAFNNTYVGASSASSSFTVSGSLLTADIVVAAPTDFQVNTAANPTWASSVSIPFGSGTVASTTVNVRFAPGSTGAKSGNVTINSTGVTEKTVAVTGTGLAPTITTTAGTYGPFCNTTSNNITVAYTTAGTITGTYAVQHSAAGGTFPNDVTSNLLATVSSSAGSITATFPSGLTAGNYRVRVVNSAPATMSSNNNNSNIVVSAPVTQVVASSAANAIGATNATLNGNVTTVGVCPASNEKGFVYSLTSANANPEVGGTGVTKTQVGSSTITTGAYTLGISGLTPNTSYTFNSYVYNGTTYTYGTVRTFTTSNPTAALSSTLNEGTLTTTNTFTITLAGELFLEAPAFTGTGFILGGAPAGVTLVSVARVSDTQATVTLAYDNTDFDTNASINITIPESHITDSNDLVSGNLTITAVNETLVSANAVALGSQCIGTTTTNGVAFTITGNAKAGNISLAAVNGYTYSANSSGTYTATLDIAHAGGAVNQTVYVKFSPVNTTDNYNGTIVISAPAVNTSLSKSVTGTGVNTAPTVAAPTSGSVTGTTAVLGGNITSIGCSNATVRGIEYSLTNNFTAGTGAGTVVSENGTFTTGIFTVNVGSLTPATQYFYKAFATNGGGTVYSAQGTFTTACVTPVNVTAIAATTPAGSQIKLDWTNSSCSDEVLVVAKLGSAVTATPSGDGTAYTANDAFGSGTAIATGEFVVYNGSAATVTVTGLTNGSTYHFKVFTRKGSNWSAGVETSGVPVVTYCTASAANATTYEHITSVTFNGETNSSGSSNYSNFTSTVFQAEHSQSYPLTITIGAPYTNDKGLVYVDWNNDGDFADADETVLLANGAGPGPYTGTITVPATSFVGAVRMRIRIYDSSGGETAGACGTTTYGEVEDYTLNVVQGTPAPEALLATNITPSGFTARWNEVEEASSYRLDVYTKSASAATTTEGFNLGFTLQPGWTTTVNGTYTSNGNFGASSPSLQFDNTGDVLETATYPGPASSLSFFIRSNGGSTSVMLIEGYNGTSWVTVHSFTGLPTTGITRTYDSASTPALPSGLVKFRFTFTKNAGNVAFDDLSVTYANTTNNYLTGYQNKTIDDTAVNNIISHPVTGAAQNTQYFYVVRALTPVSSNSNEIAVTTGKENIWTSTGWSLGTPPTTIDKAVIEYDYNTGTVAEITAAQLLVNAGTFTIADGDNVIITNEVVVNNTLNAQGNIVGPKIVIENNANLIQVNDVDNTGNIQVFKKSAPVFRMDYALWSSPVAGETLRGFSPITAPNRFYQYNSSTDSYTGTGMNDGNVPFEEGKSYLIRVSNNHPDYVAPAEGQPEPTGTRWEGNYIGVPNNGNVNVTVTPAGSGTSTGFNALGNPYPSPINIHAFYDANQGSIDPLSALYFWRKKNDSETGSYAKVTKLAYAANQSNDFGDASNGQFTGAQDQWVINPGQGFIVKSTGSTIQFNNDMRRAVNNNQQFRNAQETTDASRMWLNITGAQSGFSQAVIGYTDATTNGIDYGWDGRAFTNDDLVLFSYIDENKVSIQARASFADTDEVPMGYKATTAGTYSISLDHMDGVFAQDQDIFLRDNVLGLTHDLRQGGYEFATEAGTISGRFDVVYASALNTNNPVFR